jgi:hypothetical protein
VISRSTNIRAALRAKQRGFIMTPYAFGAAGGSDPNFGSVGSLLHFNGTNGSTTFTDVKGNTWTPNACTITTAESKFGGASGNFTVNGAHIRTGSASWFDFGAGDFTIECWAKKGAGGSGDQHLWDAWSSRFLFRYRNGAPQLFLSGVSGGSPLLSFSATISSSVFTHVALVRNGNTWTCYFDGTSVATTTNSGTISSTADNLTIGNSDGSGDTFGGYIDEFRVTKGVARYTANFTPPTTAFPDS